MHVNRKAGFTLVEMTVVLIIITLLMAVSSAAIGGAKRSAQRTRTLNVARQLVDAWGLYLQDERAFPKPSSFHDRVEGDNCFRASAYNIGKFLNTQYTAQNKAKAGSKIYFETTKSECERSGGAEAYSFKGSGILDNWKEPLVFTLDFDLDGKIADPTSEAGRTVNASALVYSTAGAPEKKKKYVVAWN